MSARFLIVAFVLLLVAGGKRFVGPANVVYDPLDGDPVVQAASAWLAQQPACAAGEPTA